jgi:phage tail sheath gpL-like
MTIAFNNIPANWKVPLYWVELDSSMAGLGTPRQPALLAGTMLSTGTAPPDIARPIATQAQADDAFGIGSELSRMFKAFFANNFANEVRGVGVMAPTAAVAASAPLVVAAAPTEAGTIHLYIGADHVPINVAATDTEEEIADAIAEAINDREWLPVTASTTTSGGPLNTARPSLSGAPVEGGTVTTTNGTWTNNPDSFAITWQRDGTDIVGATAANYTPVTADVGTVLTSTVVASNATGDSLPATSLPSDPVDPAPLLVPVNVTAPVLSESLTAQQRRRPAVARTRAAAPTPLTITCKWGGVTGNDIRISLNYMGAVGGQILPPGLDITLPPTGMLTGGSGVPDFTNTISNLGESPVEYLAMPYTDAVSLADWELEFGFSDSGRWGWMRQLYGGIYSARRGSYSDLIAFGSSGGRNSAQVSPMGFEIGSPSPCYEWAAAYCAKAQRALTNDPARPLQTLMLEGILMAPPDQRFIISETNLLATYGIATQRASADDIHPMISRETTMYQVNLYGFEDDAYELVTTNSTLAALIRNQRQVITTKYARCKLANDGTRFGPGQRVATPGIIKAELVSQYRVDMFNGLCEDIRNFKEHLITERDANNPNRLNVLYPPDLINQLRIFAVVNQFRLQYNRGLDEQIAA